MARAELGPDVAGIDTTFHDMARMEVVVIDLPDGSGPGISLQIHDVIFYLPIHGAKWHSGALTRKIQDAEHARETRSFD